MKALSAIFILILLAGQAGVGQDADTVATILPASPVVLGSDTLFFVRVPLGAFSAAERAERTMFHLNSAMAQSGFSPDSFFADELQTITNVRYRNDVIFCVTDSDAVVEENTRATVASERISRLRTYLAETEENIWDVDLLISLGISLAALAALVLVFWFLRKIFPNLYAAMEQAEGKLIRGVRIRSFELLSTETMGDFFQILARGLRLLLSLVAIYAATSLILRQFPLTRDIGLEPYLFGLLASILITAIAAGVVRSILKFHTWSSRLIHGWKGTLIQPVRIKSVEVLSEDRIAELLVLSVKFGRFVLIGILVYFYISTILGLFPITATWSETLFGYILTPFVNALRAFVNYIPKLFSIIVIIALTSYLLRFMRFITTEVARGTISFPGFYKDWALPTFKIARFLVIVFSAVVIFPYLPGSDSPFFQGISIFVGVLFSLGSSSAVANVVSGVVLTYMRPFQVGDRVKIADTVGDIIEKTLLVTRVRTIKNVDITVPNAMVLGTHIVNYSSSSENRGLILHTAVTIGYDVPWRKVHDLLLEAAKRTENIQETPAPFVFQTALNDFSVAYELNAYTNEPSVMAKTYSRMHENIQDVFNDAGVEILSPAYAALRDGNESTVPPEKKSADTKPGFFRFQSE